MVYTLVSDGDVSFARDVTERLVAHLAKLGTKKKVSILSKSDVAFMIGYAKREPDMRLEDCQGSEECLAKIPADVESDYAFKGRVEYFGGNFVGVLTRLDLKRSTPPLSETHAAESKEELTQAMLRIGAEMLGLEEHSSRSKLMEPISSANKKVALIP